MSKIKIPVKTEVLLSNIEHAMTLLCSAAPNENILSKNDQVEWKEGFKMWFSNASEILSILKP